MKIILQTLLAQKDPSAETVTNFMDALCDKSIVPEQKAFAFGILMAQGITEGFLTHAANHLLSKATPLNLGDNSAIDVCGTGGDSGNDQIKTFNISTAVAFVLAAGGVPVIKHGNKAISSQSGSSDVLTALAVPFCTTAEEAKSTFDKNNLCFVSAPHFHPLMKNFAPLRQALGIPTFLNLLGPLINPAKVKRQLIGVYDPSMASQIIKAAKLLGKTDVMVAHAQDGLDEISLCAPTLIHHLSDGILREIIINPEDFGVKQHSLESIRGGSSTDNAKIIEDIFTGATTPAFDIVCLNAAAAFVVAGKDKDFKEGFSRAQQVIKSGKAQQKLLAMRAK